MEDNLFEFHFTDEDDIGVFNIALVSDPANLTEMIYLNNDAPVEWQLANEEKQIVIGAVLIPDQKIYRRNIQGQEGYFFMSAMTIEKLQQNFAKQQYGNTSNLEHLIPIEGVYVTESWIIENPVNDKANALGMIYPKGTWMVAMKIENKEVWDEYVKTKKVRGYSVEMVIPNSKITKQQKPIKMNMENETNAEIENIEVSEEQTIDTIIDNVIEEATIEIEQTEPIEEIVDLAKEMSGTTTSYETETDAEEVETQVSDEEVVDEAMIQHEQEIAMLKAQVLEYENRIAELEAKNVQLEAQIVLVEEEKVLLSNQTPASKPIIDAPMIEEEIPANGVLGVLRKYTRK